MKSLSHCKLSNTLVALLLTLFCFSSVAYAQQAPAEFKAIDLRPFQDATHHWYDITDNDKVVSPVPDQPKYKPTQITGIADNILLYQKNNGGWPKNYDITAILTEDQKTKLIAAKNDLHTTFDNGTSYTHVEYLAAVYTTTKFAKYKDACLKGIDFMLSAQYKNGGWPQYYPLQKDYSRCITFNDDAFIGIMEVFKNILDDQPEYAFVDAATKQKIKTSFTKGIDCILKTQIKDDNKLTSWCQQYDEISLQPAWARKFEPPSICNAEGAGIVLFLMKMNNPDKNIINAIEAAVTWFEESAIKGIRVKTIPAEKTVYKFRTSSTDRIVVNDSLAAPIWTRYYEIGSHKPLFCNRDSKVVYSLAEVERERRDGYGWYTYKPQEVLNQYKAWHQKWSL